MDNPTLAEQAVALHEIFTSYLQAGFRREEALELTKTTMAINYDKGRNNG